jgi:hypothetical protein
MLQQNANASMVQNAQSGLAGIEAELNFIIPDERKPFSHQYDPPPGTPVRSHPYENRKVFIQDGRPLADAFSVDREGFALVQHTTKTTDLYDQVELKNSYYPETEALLKTETGASKILIFDHTIRTSHDRPRGVGLPREAVLRVHNDYTLKSGPQRVRDLVPEEAESRLKKRFAIINVWRPIVGPLQQFPLALGDAESLRADDVLATDLIYPDRVGEIYSIAYNPAQRWFYFPEMSRDEVVLIKTYDSDPARARFSAHGAFADPNFPDPKVLRESIELRALVFW